MTIATQFHRFGSGARRLASRLAAIGTLAAFVFVQAVAIMAMTTTAASAITISGECQVTSTEDSMAYGATDLSWQTLSTNTLSHATTETINQMKGGTALVNNNLGAAVAKIPASFLSTDLTMRERHAAPVVMAMYDPQTGVGAIFVDRAIVNAHGDLVLEQIPFTPKDGIVLSRAYDGNNPFWQFEPGVNGNPTTGDADAFVKIAANAFYTAVGMVLRHFDAQRGLIATLKMKQDQSQQTSGGFFTTTVTTTPQDWAQPQWTMVFPSGQVSGGFTSGYKFPICNPVTGTPMMASTASAAQGQASLWSSAATQGGPTSLPVGSQQQAALTVPAGVEYIQQGTDSVNLDTSKWLAYEHQVSQTGLGFFAVLFIAVAASVLTWGAADAVLGAAYPAAQTALTTALQSIGITGSTSTVAAGAGAIFGAGATAVNYALNMNANPGGVTPAFLIGQDSTIPTLGSAGLVSYNLNQYLKSLYASPADSGVDTGKYASNPTSPTTGWNGGIGTLSKQATPTNQQTAAGSMGVQANASLNNAKVTANGAPSLNRVDQEAPITGNDSAGALPQAP